MTFSIVIMVGRGYFLPTHVHEASIFFSIFRKGILVAPLTYILAYGCHMGTDGVFAAEPISNVIGGLACFFTMLITVMRPLKKQEKEQK